jgi:hypothetical protein
MATGSWPTIADLASRTAGRESKQAYIAEMMSQSNDIWDDMVHVEANEMGGHEFVFRESIPMGSWRQANQGVPYGKSTTGKARVAFGSLEGYSQVDRLIAEDSGDIALFRENEDVSFIEGLGQTMAATYFYGNTVIVPAQFMGLSGFYNTIANAQNGANVLSGGGGGSSNTSMWLLCHGERTIFSVFPRGSKAGLAQEDKGDTVPGFDSVGNRFEAFTSWFRHQMGVCPQDWRQAVRWANVDTTATAGGLASSSPPDIFATLAQIVFLIPAIGKASGISKLDAPNDPHPSVRPVITVNRTLRHWMDVQAMRNKNVLATINDYDGRVVDGFRQIPIKICDQILNTEAPVV